MILSNLACKTTLYANPKYRMLLSSRTIISFLINPTAVMNGALGRLRV